MKILNKIIEKSYKYKDQDVKSSINNSRSLDKDMKEKILKYISKDSYYDGGAVFSLSIPSDLRKKHTVGYRLGADNKGFFIYTHRSGSDRYDEPNKIPVSVIKRVNSTG